MCYRIRQSRCLNMHNGISRYAEHVGNRVEGAKMLVLDLKSPNTTSQWRFSGGKMHPLALCSRKACGPHYVPANT